MNLPLNWRRMLLIPFLFVAGMSPGCEGISGPAVQNRATHDVTIVAYYSDGSIHRIELRPNEELAQRAPDLTIDRLVVINGKRRAEYSAAQLNALCRVGQSIERSVIIVEETEIKVIPITTQLAN